MNSKFIPWLIIAALALILFIDVKMHCGNPSPTGQQTPDSTLYWRNKYGDAYASLQKKEIDFGIEEQTYLDSIAALNNTQANLIKEVISYKSHGIDTIWEQTEPGVITVHDTLNPKCPDQVIALSKTFRDPYYTADVTITRLGHNSKIIIESFDTLTSVFKTVKEGGFLGFNQKEFLQLDIHSANPYNKITGLHAYRVPAPEPKKWGIGLFVGYGYSFGTSQTKATPIVGLGVTRTFIRF